MVKIRLKNMLVTNCNQELDILLQNIYDDILKFRKDAEQSDDITMLTFSWKV